MNMTASIMHASHYYVAPDGCDENNGNSLTNPFRTIQKAARMAKAGNTVYIRKGVYRETVIPQNSGIAENPIVFQAFHDEEVLISGLDMVETVWTQYEGNIYYTNVKMDMEDRNAVFVDGKRMTYARWPNKTGASPMNNDGAEVEAGSLSSIYDSDMPNRSLGWYDGAVVWSIAGAKWTALGATVTSSGGGTVNFTLPGDMTGEHNPGDTSRGDGNYYYLAGKLGLLDTENEWFYDSSAEKLYLYAPGGGNPGGRTVEIKARDQAIDLTDKSYITFKNIDIKGAQIKIAGDHNVIEGMNASHIFTHNARGMYHTHPAADVGIHITGSYNTVNNGNFGYSDGNMFLIDSGAGNVIENNYIHHVDLNGCYDAAIRLENNFGDDRHTLIIHNTIYCCGRSAIHFCRPAHFKYNEVYSTDIVGDDGAPVYCGGDLKNSEIAFNVVHDIYWKSGSRAGVVSGIYMDGGSSNCTAHHNLLYNIGQDAAFRFNAWSNGERNCFNNTTYNCPPDLIIVWGEPVFSEANNFHNQEASNFIDAEHFNLSLAPGSAAINAGIVISPWTDGYTGGAPDLGCYEYGGTCWIAGVI